MAPLHFWTSFARVAFLTILAALVAEPAVAQTPSSLLGSDWVGAVRCDIKATAPGYLHEERQTWTLTGAPTTQGSMLVFPATWTVTGRGTHDRTRYSNRRVAEWVAAVPGPNPPVNAPIAFQAAAVTGQINVQLWHSQLTRQGGYTGTDQFINDGVAQPPGRLVATLYEWQFPRITAEPKSTRISGSITHEARSQVGPLQPLSESQVTIACAWELGRGTASPLPPSTVPDAPSSGSTSSSTPPAGPPGTTTTPTGSTASTSPGSTTTPPGSTASTGPGSTTAPPGSTASTSPGSTTTPPGSTASTNPPGSTTSPPGGTTSPPPANAARILSINNTTFEQGAFDTVVVLTGSSTHWSQETPVVTVEPGIGAQIDTVQAESDTSLYVALPIQYSAATGARSITVRTGTEVVTLPNAFTITPKARPLLSGIAPATGRQGEQDVTITITGQNTGWAQDRTTFWIGLPFDGSKPSAPVPPQYVTTKSLTVHSASSATAVVSIAPDAIVGPYWVLVGPPGVDGLLNTTGFTVTSAPASSSTTPPSPPVTTPPGAATGPLTAPTAPANSLPGRPPGGELTAIPGTMTATPPITPVDPANFTATQTADGTVTLSWSAVPGAGSYMLGGPGTNAGVAVTGTSHTVTGIAPGTHTWTVATNYSPGGVMTTPDKWSKTTAAVVNRTGRYRISLTGFRVNHETNAGPFGGEHNAVYAAAAIEVLNRSTQAVLQPHTVVRSLVHGDTSKGGARVRAGSASPTGGLLAGDTVPMGEDPASITRSTSTTTFPLLLWEGPLTDGIEVVAVRPSLWVWNGATRVYDKWLAGLSHPQRYISDEKKARIGNGDMSPSFGGSDFDIWCSESGIYDTAHAANCLPADDRPIGLVECNAFLGCWFGVSLFIARDGIERALSSPYQTGGSAPGVIQIHFADQDPSFGFNRFSGNYDLYLRVERVP